MSLLHYYFLDDFRVVGSVYFVTPDLYGSSLRLSIICYCLQSNGLKPVVTKWDEATPLNLTVWSRHKVGESITFSYDYQYFFPDYSRAVGSINFINAGFQSGADNANKA